MLGRGGKSGAAKSVIGGSITEMIKFFVVVFPASSVAEHSTVVLPIGNTNPDWGEQEIVT